MKHLEKGKRRSTTIDIDQKFIQQGSSINSRGRSCTGRSTRKVREPNLRGEGGPYRFNNITDHRSLFPKVKFRFFLCALSFACFFAWFSRETACAVTTPEGVYIARFCVRGTSVNKVSTRSGINGAFKLWNNLQTVNT